MAATKRNAKPYTPAALFRVSDKQGNILGYAVPSRDGTKTYHVTPDQNGCWHCDCPASVDLCCHVKAVGELCGIRAKQVTETPVAEIVEQLIVEVVKQLNSKYGKTVVRIGVPVVPEKKRASLVGNWQELPAPVSAPTPVTQGHERWLKAS